MKPSNNKDTESEKREQNLHRWDRVVQTTIWLIDHDVPQLIIKLIMWILSFFFR